MLPPHGPDGGMVRKTINHFEVDLMPPVGNQNPRMDTGFSS